MSDEETARSQISFLRDGDSTLWVVTCGGECTVFQGLSVLMSETNARSVVTIVNSAPCAADRPMVVCQRVFLEDDVAAFLREEKSKSRESALELAGAIATVVEPLQSLHYPLASLSQSVRG